MAAAPRLCLTMIVKDEARILERCLAAAAPHVDSYAILDTGSTDGTPGLVRDFFAARGIPGVVGEGEFRDFSQARNDGLALARSWLVQHHGALTDDDWLLLCDADMELVVDDPTFVDRLTGPVHLLEQRSSALRYANVRLVRAGAEAAYVGATHEVLTAPGATPTLVTGAWFVDHAEGSSRTEKFERDLRLLERSLTEDPTDARAQFYLAQTLRDAGRPAEAREAYATRAAMGGWDEEVWYARFQVAVLTERLGEPDDLVIGRYLDAWQSRPGRVEPLVELARFCREHGPRWPLAHWVAERAVATPPTTDVLFVDHAAEGWRAVDELSIAAYWVGDYAGCERWARALLARDDLPAEQRARVEENLGHALRMQGR